MPYTKKSVDQEKSDKVLLAKNYSEKQFNEGDTTNVVEDQEKKELKENNKPFDEALWL